MTGHTVRLLRATGALAVLLAVIVGVPLLLAALRLVPHSMPSPDHVLTVLRSRDDGQLAEIVLAAGVWVCWALFTASTIAEIVALAGARRATALRGLGVFQRPAAALVTAIAVGFTIAPLATGTAASFAAAPPLPVATGSGVGTASAHADAGAAEAQQAAADPSPDSPPLPTARTYRVQRRDTLWALAERYLGDPLRYPEIVRLNPTAVGPDNEISPGTVLVMPADATGLPPTTAAPDTTTTIEDVTVQPGDTLWDLAEAVTGHGENWRQAWALNRGRPEPGGATLTDPSLIRPGWTLSIPGPGGSPPPAPSSPVPEPPAVDPRPTPEPAPPTAGPAPAPVSTAAPTVPDSGEPSTAAPTTQTTAAPAAPSRAVAGPAESSPAPPLGPVPEAAWGLPMVAFAGGGLLLAGVSLAALLRSRRRQFRHRRPGRLIAGTPPQLLRVERAVHTAGSAALPDLAWLDRALRGLAQAVSAVDGARLPDVIAACLTDDVLTLVLTEPSLRAPKPWTVDAAGTRWSIHRSDPLTYDEQRRAYHFAPYPTLASVGSTADGEHWLMDLERAGALCVSGDPEGCLNLVRFLAAELAHNTWSEMLQVTMVGFGKELTQTNPDRLSFTDDVDQVITAVNADLRSVIEAMRAADVDVLSGRLHDIAGDAWAPHVVLVAAHAARDSAGLQALVTAISDQRGRAAIALLVVGDPDQADTDGWQLTVDHAGTLHIPALGAELVANQVPADEAAQLAQLLAAAAVTDDRPIPPAHGDRPWDAYADACGGLHIDPANETSALGRAPASAPGGDVPVRGPADVSPPPAATFPEAACSVLPLSSQTYSERAATTEQDLNALAPATDHGIRHRVQAADPVLDDDLADWADPACPRPKLTLLGPVGVRARGSLPERNPRQHFYTEIVAYLATRPTGVTSEQYATSIWPQEADILGKTKVRQSISIVRAWLGTDPTTGRDYLPAAAAADRGGSYRIDGVLIDAELFRRLRLRGQARGADGVPDLQAALDLVTGKPFDHLPSRRRGAPGGYTWLIEDNCRLDHEYAAMIVDVAHTVATHHLAAGQPELAADAARVALKAGSFEDVPLLDLVAACDAQGHRAEADAYVQRILANHDAEVEEDLPPRTAEILFRRHWGNPAN